MKIAIRRGPLKYVATFEGDIADPEFVSRLVREEAHDRSQDPGETNDLFGSATRPRFRATRAGSSRRCARGGPRIRRERSSSTKRCATAFARSAISTPRENVRARNARRRSPRPRRMREGPRAKGRASSLRRRRGRAHRRRRSEPGEAAARELAVHGDRRPGISLESPGRIAFRSDPVSAPELRFGLAVRPPDADVPPPGRGEWRRRLRGEVGRGARLERTAHRHLARVEAGEPLEPLKLLSSSKARR